MTMQETSSRFSSKTASPIQGRGQARASDRPHILVRREARRARRER